MPFHRFVRPALAVLLSALALPSLVPAVALAGARQEGTVIMPDDAAARKIWDEWGFAEAVVHGDTVWLSGVVVWQRPGETDLEAAYVRAFERMGKTLAKAGVGWDDVVDITSYHTDLTAQLDAMVKVKHRYIKEPFPAWTAIGITRLVPDDGLTEIKLVAKRPAGPQAVR